MCLKRLRESPGAASCRNVSVVLTPSILCGENPVHISEERYVGVVLTTIHVIWSDEYSRSLRGTRVLIRPYSTSMVHIGCTPEFVSVKDLTDTLKWSVSEREEKSLTTRQRLVVNHVFNNNNTCRSHSRSMIYLQIQRNHLHGSVGSYFRSMAL